MPDSSSPESVRKILFLNVLSLSQQSTHRSLSNVTLFLFSPPPTPFGFRQAEIANKRRVIEIRRSLTGF